MSSANNPIRLAILLDIDPATGAAKVLRQTVTTEMGAAAAAAEQSAARIEKSLVPAFGNVINAAKQAGRSTAAALTPKIINDTTAATDRLGGSLRGLRPGVAVLSAGFAELGDKAGSQLAQLGGHLAQVAVVGGTVGAALAAVGTSMFAFEKVSEWMSGPLAKSMETINRVGTEQSSVYKGLDAIHQKSADAAEARSRGISLEALATEKAIGSETRAAAAAQAQFDVLKREGNSPDEHGGFLWLGLSDTAEAMRKAAGDVEIAQGNVRQSTQNLTDFQGEQSRVLNLTWSNETRAYATNLAKQADAAKLHTAELADMDKLKGMNLPPLAERQAGLGIGLRYQLTGVDQTALASVNSQEQDQLAGQTDQRLIDQIRAHFDDVRAKLPAVLAPLKAAMAKENAAIVADAGADAAKATVEPNRAMLLATRDAQLQVENLKRNSLDAQLADLTNEYNKEKYEAQRHGEDMAALGEKYAALIAAAKAKYAGVAGQRTLAADDERIVLNDPNATMAQGFNVGLRTGTANIPTNAELGAQIAQIGVKTGDAVTQGLDSALEKSIESGSFKGFAAALEQTTTKAITDGLVDALTTATIKRPMEQAFSSLTGGVGSVAGVAGSASGGGSGAVSAGAMADDPGNVFFAKSARMSPQQVHIYVSDKAAASIQLGGTNAKGVPRGKGARRGS